MTSPFTLFLILFATTTVVLNGCDSTQGQTQMRNSHLNRSPVPDNSDYYGKEMLRSDLRQADIVAYVDSREIISVVPSDEKTDCTNFDSNTGPGYCGFVIKSEIKELYKGKLSSDTIEYFEYREATAIKSKEHYLGPQIIFLERFENEKTKKTYYQVIENSTRRIDNNVISKMREISKYKVKSS